MSALVAPERRWPVNRMLAMLAVRCELSPRLRSDVLFGALVIVYKPRGLDP